MKKNLLSIALIGAIGLSTFNADAIDLTSMSRRYVGVDSPVKALTHRPGEEGVALKAMPQRITESENPSSTVSDAMAWGFLAGPDGSEWFYSQTFVLDGWYYASSEVTVYDNNYQEVTKFTVTAPEGMSVNQIEPFGAVTYNFFDGNNATNEIAVFHHAVTPDYMGKFWVDIYSLTTGEIINTYDCESAMFFDATTGFTTNYKFITCQSDGEGNIDIDIYKRAGWDSSEPVVEHTFNVEEKLINYMDASYINAYNLDGEIYYVLNHYEKEFMQPSDDMMSDPVPTEDNTFVIKVYNADYESVTTVNIPLEGGEDAYYTFAGFGIFSTCDLSKGKYTGDDKLNFVVTRYDYLLSSDGYVYHFDVYDENGDKVANIGNRAAAWFHLSPVKGFEDQVALIKTDVGEGQIEMVDLPSCNLAVILPGIIDGRFISSNFDRCLEGGDYKYVISVSQGDIDDEGNIIASIGWYDRNGQIDRYVDFNLGPNAEYFSAYINGEILNPYMIDTDNEHEYVFLAKLRNPSDSSLSNSLYIAKEDGTIIRQFTDNDEKGLYYNGGFIASDTSNATLFIAYIDEDNDLYTLDFYRMPFEKFEAGGDGTEENPYLISSVGDLQQIVNEPTAFYRLVNDIDMADCAGSWQPIPTFTGTLDGQNHAIKNLYLNCNDDYCGLFGSIEPEAVIKDLIFIDPKIELTHHNYYSGILAGMTMKATISNLHIFNAEISGDDNTNTVGGLIGEASYYTSITSCSLNDLTIDTPNAVNVGGVVGDTRTSTNVVACYVGKLYDKSYIKGASDVGGIVGTTGSDSGVNNCRVDADIEGQYNVGGIVANCSSRAVIANNIAHGSVSATAVNNSQYANTGGILGYLEADWAGTSSIKCLRKNIAAQNRVSAPGNAKGVNRIVGWTVNEVSFNEDEEPIVEIGLSKNYANSNMYLCGSNVTSDDASSVNGADFVVADADKQFYLDIDFKYGKNSSNPWKEDTATPVLFFQNIAKYIALDITEIQAVEGEKVLLTATVYGNTIENITLTSSDENVAEILPQEQSGENPVNSCEFTVQIKSVGSAAITAACDELSATCLVTGLSSVDELQMTAEQISFDGQQLCLPGATEISVYSTDGILIAHADTDVLNVGSLSNGLYIAVAVKDHCRVTRKFIIR